MSRIYVFSAYLIISVVAAEFMLTIAVFAGRIQSGSLGLDQPLPDDGAGLGHQMLGLYVMPVVVTSMLISSFDTRYKGSTRWALVVCLIYLSDVGVAYLGYRYGVGFVALHILLALVLSVAAVHAARRLRTAPPDEKWDLDDFR